MLTLMDSTIWEALGAWLSWSWILTPFLLILALGASMRAAWGVVDGLVKPLLKAVSWLLEWIAALGIGFIFLSFVIRLGAVWIGSLDGALGESLESGMIEGIRMLGELEKVEETK